ncbi:MAG: hypothetical protein AAGI50_19625 [Pseudomonadota bacterium]
MSVPIVVNFVAIVGVTVVGDWMLKKASLAPSWSQSPWFAGGLLCYMASGVGIVIAMRYMTLAAVGVWYSVLTIVFMTLLGVFAFGETLTARDGAGIVLALGALALMARHA